MGGRYLAPIQPKPGVANENNVEQDSPPNTSRRNRKTVLVACDPCRRLKTKCDGERPSCRRCRNKGQECTYELPQDALSRSSARKEVSNQLHRENVELRQLFHDLSKRPESEALNLFRRLRAAEDPIALVHSIRQAELLLLPPSIMEDGVESITLQQLESNALRKSSFKIPALPWTNVAGDGIVSELISAWFKWDNAFVYPFIDRECFIQDIRNHDPKNAVACSPFLVNAICALRSYFSDTVDMVWQVTKQNLKAQFLFEAKKEFDHASPSIPTIQGLWIMFAISALIGEGKTGSLYQFASFGLLKRCRLDERFSSLTDTDANDIMRKRVISKTIWGLYCSESLMAINFRNIHQFRSPKIPCPFLDFNIDVPSNFDIFGQEFTASSPQPPFVEGVISILCRLAALMNEILVRSQGNKGNEGSDLRSEEKSRRVMQALAQLNTIGDSLPFALRHDHNFTPGTCYLRILMNTVAYTILRPLHPDMVLDENDTPKSVQSMTLGYCELDTELMERYFATWSTSEFTMMAFMGPLNSGAALLPLLPKLPAEQARQLFPRVCRLMHVLAERIPVARYVLKGWQAALMARNLPIPGPVKPYFENINDGRDIDFDAISTNLVVADVPKGGDMVSSDEWDDGELDFLLKKWTAMSLK
ncbi:putative C6 transcription factor [Astrocystis sublimbata]|nr:putative C6 transcription factor [Astrocystis sublimbata]